MSAVQKIRDFLERNIVRGECTCGKCVDAGSEPEKHQPEGHTVDMAFFQVAFREDIFQKAVREGMTDPVLKEADELRELITKNFPQYFDGNEHSYLEVGADMDDQGTALMLIGAGHLLGLWKAMTPTTVLGDLISDEMKMQMAGMGMISLKCCKEERISR